MEKIQPNFFAIVPSNVRYDNDLKANAKLLYGEITALTNAEGYCWATNKYFAELYKVSEETVSRWISQLKKKGYIDVVIHRKDLKITARHIYITDKALMAIKPTPAIEEVEQIEAIDNNVNTDIDKNVNIPLDKKVKENNKDINIEVLCPIDELEEKRKSKRKKSELKPTEKMKSIINHFNSKMDTNFQADTKKSFYYLKELAETYELEHIKEVLDFAYEILKSKEGTDKFDTELHYWQPTTKFNLENFNKIRSWYETDKLKKKAGHPDKKIPAPLDIIVKYYIITSNGTITATRFPKGTLGIDYFNSKDEAENYNNLQTQNL